MRQFASFTARATKITHKAISQMSIEDLKKSLEYLAVKYVADSSALAELTQRIQQIQPPGFPAVKGVLADIHSHIVEVDPKDSDLFREIGFHYL
ncbi:MAG: hypothetical protein RLY20_1967 [Verrucomicrobiota bacterium]|jgi:hypothetical protein